MQHRKLGSTGIAVSKIALGTMYFGSETPEEDAFAILDTFIEAGGNLIDTADVYVGQDLSPSPNRRDVRVKAHEKPRSFSRRSVHRLLYRLDSLSAGWAYRLGRAFSLGAPLFFPPRDPP